MLGQRVGENVPARAVGNEVQRPGDDLRMLDCSRGWAWGYLADGRVVYITADAVSS